MIIELEILPVAAVVILLASRRVTVLQAGLAGALLTIPAVAMALGPTKPLLTFLMRNAAAGAWLAWQAISVVLAGLIFYNVLRVADQVLFSGDTYSPIAFSYRQIFAVCFLLGPFLESVTGFGVALIITIPILLRMGVKGPMVAVLALFSQTLVPWGALAIGTVIGAGLADVPLHTVGVRSALITGPLLFGYLIVFWSYAHREGWRVDLWQRIDDVAWVGALVVMLYLSNQFVEVQAAGLIATSLLLGVRFWRDVRISAAARQALIRVAQPYVWLTLIILVTRVFPPLRGFLRGLWLIQPSRAWPVFSVFYQVSFWLLAVAIVYGLKIRLSKTQWKAVGVGVWHAGRAPVMVILAFVVMAQWISRAGIAADLAMQWAHFAGPVAIWASPVFSAIAGFLTGSNTASNALVMPLQMALAKSGGLSPGWAAAMQNTAGSNFTLLSPVRIAMGAALLHAPNAENSIYRLALPLGVTALAMLVLMVVLGL